MFTKCTKFFLTREAHYPQNMKYCALYQLRLDSLLYLSHTSCQMVFLFARFVSANRLRQTDVASTATRWSKESCHTEWVQTFSSRSLMIKKKKKKHPPLIPIPHLDWICGLKIEGRSLIRITKTQTFQSKWKGNLYVSNRAPCPLWNVNQHPVYRRCVCTGSTPASGTISAGLVKLDTFYCLLAWQVARPEIFLLVHFVIGLPTTQVCYSMGRLPLYYLFTKISGIIPLLITLSAA